MSATSTQSNRVKYLAGVVVAAGSMSLAAFVGPAVAANADPVVILNGETVDPPTPGLVSPWPGGAWAGHDWSTGWPGGAWAGHDWSKGWPGGGYANGKAGGAWNHTAE